MKKFSIKELEGFLDIKAHTIRIWEQRYDVVKPERSKGNVRSYTIKDAEFLLNLVLLNKNGFSISKVSGMSKETRKQERDGLQSKEAQHLKAVNSLIISMYSAEIDAFEEILNKCQLLLGIDITIRKVIIPFLEKVQLLSYEDSSIEAHFAVTAVRKKLILGIEDATPLVNAGKKVLLFLPKGEHYDLVLLYLTYIIKSEGFKVLYLGTNITKENLGIVSKTKNPDYLLTYSHAKKTIKMHDYAKYVEHHLPGLKLLIAQPEYQVNNAEDARKMNFFYFNDVFGSMQNLN